MKSKIEIFIKRHLNPGKFNFFFLFVLVSFSFWIITKMSKTYIAENSFKIFWTDTPENYILKKDEKKLKLIISASGLDFIIYKIFMNEINISLNNANFDSGLGTLNIQNQIINIQNQLFKNTSLVNILNNKISFYYSELSSKLISVKPNYKIIYRPGYRNDNSFKIYPDSIKVIGPIDLLDKLKHVKTQEFSREDVFQSIDVSLKLTGIDGLKYNTNSVQLTTSVSRYTEKKLLIPVTLINLPDSIRLKLFPRIINLKVIMSLNEFKNISLSDFEITADYSELNHNSNGLSLFLNKFPSGLKEINWEPKRVNYLIRK